MNRRGSPKGVLRWADAAPGTEGRTACSMVLCLLLGTMPGSWPGEQEDQGADGCRPVTGIIA